MTTVSGMTAYDEARLMAAADLIGRTGAKTFQLRYTDDEQPVVWIAVGAWVRDGQLGYETGSGLDPLRAALRLCEQVVDGGQCRRCHRPTGIEPDSLDTMPADDAVCWYQFDPGAKSFVRGCT